MNKEKRRILYQKVKTHATSRPRYLRFPSFQPNYERKVDLEEDLDWLEKVEYRSNTRRESQVWCERYDALGPISIHTYRGDEFWDFLFSVNWEDVSSIRVCEGELLERILEHLFLLQQDGRLDTYKMARFDRCPKPAPRGLLKTSSQYLEQSEKTVPENVKILFTYYAPNAAAVADQLVNSCEGEVLYSDVGIVNADNNASGQGNQWISSSGGTQGSDCGSVSTTMVSSDPTDALSATETPDPEAADTDSLAGSGDSTSEKEGRPISMNGRREPNNCDELDTEQNSVNKKEQDLPTIEISNAEKKLSSFPSLIKNGELIRKVEGVTPIRRQTPPWETKIQIDDLLVTPVGFDDRDKLPKAVKTQTSLCNSSFSIGSSWVNVNTLEILKDMSACQRTTLTDPTEHVVVSDDEDEEVDFDTQADQGDVLTRPCAKNLHQFFLAKMGEPVELVDLPTRFKSVSSFQTTDGREGSGSGKLDMPLLGYRKGSISGPERRRSSVGTRRDSYMQGESDRRGSAIPTGQRKVSFGDSTHDVWYRERRRSSLNPRQRGDSVDMTHQGVRRESMGSSSHRRDSVIGQPRRRSILENTRRHSRDLRNLSLLHGKEWAYTKPNITPSITLAQEREADHEYEPEMNFKERVVPNNESATSKEENQATDDKPFDTSKLNLRHSITRLRIMSGKYPANAALSPTSSQSDQSSSSSEGVKSSPKQAADDIADTKPAYTPRKVHLHPIIFRDKSGDRRRNKTVTFPQDYNPQPCFPKHLPREEILSKLLAAGRQFLIRKEQVTRNRDFSTITSVTFNSRVHSNYGELRSES